MLAIGSGERKGVLGILTVVIDIQAGRRRRGSEDAPEK